MSKDQPQRTSFPLRLAVSLRDRAKILSQRDGISLNQFINLAVAEKISRLEQSTLLGRSPMGKQKIYGDENERKRP